MKEKLLFYCYSLLMMLLLVIGISAIGYTAISQEVGFNLWDITNSRWLKAPGDQTNGLDVDVTRVSGSVTVIGNATPVNNFTNPTTAVTTWSLLGGYDGSNWDLLLTTTHGDTVTTAAGLNTASIGYGWSGSQYQRLKTDPYAGSTVGIQQVRESSFSATNITTATSTIVKASAGRLKSIIIGVAGAGSTVAVYNDATSACDTNLISTIDSTVIRQVDYNITLSTGICILTTATAPNVTIIWE